MARIRSIKPEFPQSESTGRLSRDARLLFVLIWTVADDSGRTRGNSRMLASLLFPYDEDAPGLIGGWLDELEKQELVRRYTIAGAVYIEVVNWLKHQKIDKPTPSKIPAFVESSRILSKPREASTTDLEVEVEVEGNGKNKPPANKPAKFSLAAWVPENEWAAFEESRKRLRKPMTDRARSLVIIELEKLKDAGHDPASVLQQSVRKGWLDVFPLRDRPPAPGTLKLAI